MPSKQKIDNHGIRKVAAVEKIPRREGFLKKGKFPD
jgi:hypothetical protein